MNCSIEKDSLYAIKTKMGYGLFQRYKKRDYAGATPYFIIYCEQIQTLSIEDIARALSGEYYLQGFNPIIYGEQTFKELSDGGQEICGHVAFNCLDTVKQSADEVSLDTLDFDFYVESSDSYLRFNHNEIADCYLTYLGEYSFPSTAKLPDYTKILHFSYYTGKHCWIVVDESTGSRLCDAKGKAITYKKIISGIESYPRYGVISPGKLLERFNSGYYPEKDNDKAFEVFLEQYYNEHPHMRPTKERYEDVKVPLPTVNWRKMLESPQDEARYLAFCDRIDEALNTFISAIDGNRKAVRTPLITLIKRLNLTERETGQIGSLEVEDLFGYIAKILQSLKKARLIETMENLRKW
jgi:hypothetical protein